MTGGGQDICLGVHKLLATGQRERERVTSPIGQETVRLTFASLIRVQHIALVPGTNKYLQIFQLIPESVATISAIHSVCSVFLF